MTPTTAALDPLAANRAVETAAAKVAAAELAHREARHALDAALAAHGWRRVGGAFSPGSTPLYERLGSNPVTQREVLAELERERQAP
jgi:hypothetical protein